MTDQPSLPGSPDADLIAAVGEYLDLVDEMMPLYAEMVALERGPLAKFDNPRSDPRGMADALLADPPADPETRDRWMRHIPRLRDHEAAYIACGAAAVADRIAPRQTRGDNLEGQIVHQKPVTVPGAVALLRFLVVYHAVNGAATHGAYDPGDFALDLTKAGDRALAVIERTRTNGR